MKIFDDLSGWQTLFWGVVIGLAAKYLPGAAIGGGIAAAGWWIAKALEGKK